MERLTERQLKYSKYDIRDRCYVGNQWNCSAPHCMGCPIKKMYIKMQELENLEEQGLLITLPCKVGDTVYWVGIYRGKNRIIEYKIESISIYSGGNYLVVCGRTIEFWKSDFDNKKVYLSETEAEQALKEREGK